MAQLTDDCFAFSGPLLPVDEVERIIRQRVTPVGEVETVPLHAADGRVLRLLPGVPPGRVSRVVWRARRALEGEAGRFAEWQLRVGDIVTVQGAGDE